MVRKGWHWAWLPAVVGVLVFAGSLANGFALDDLRLVRDNPEIRSLAGIPRLLVEPYWPGSEASGLFRPVTVISLALNRSLLGVEALGFHAVNVLLHAAVCFLAWFAARDSGRYYGTALAAALLFAVHPLHVEAVANISGRAELLAALFVLAAWLAHRKARHPVSRRARAGWSIAAGGSYLLGLLSKESAVLAPLLFLLEDRVGRRAEASPPARTPPAIYLAYIAGLATALVLRVVALGGLRGAGTVIPLDNPAAFLGTARRLGTAVWVQAKYLALFVWPDRLSSDYSFDAIPVVESLADPRLWAGIAWIAALGLLFFYGWKRSRAIAMGAAVWALFFLPSSNLIFAAGTVMGERLAYLPSLGGCLVLGHVAAWMGSAEDSPLRALGRARVVVPIAIVALVVTAGAVRCVRRVPVWRDNSSLALHDVEVQPRSAKLHAGAGIALATLGRPVEAEAALRRAIEIYPDYAQMHYNLGQLLADRGANDEAIASLTRATQLAPANPAPYKRVAPLLEQTGRRNRALPLYAEGTRLDPADLGLRFNYGRALLAAGRAEAGRAVLQALSDENPGRIVGLLARGLIDESLGRTDEAIEIYQGLLRRDLAPQHRERILRRLRQMGVVPGP